MPQSLMALTLAERLHALAWATRIDLLLLAIAGFVFISAARTGVTDKLWKRVYYFSGTIALIFGCYLTLLITGVLNRQAYARFTQALFPVFLLVWQLPALLHKWQDKFLKQKIAEKVAEKTHTDL